MAICLAVQHKPNKNIIKTSQKINSYARYSGIAFQMMAIIAAGVFGGLKLDRWLVLKVPVFTIVLSLLAVALSIIPSLKIWIEWTRP
ncbi:MAG: AtpZ/AtpI family protein [Bacteroidales bacterium]|nr:AtpZ/AtpI family protein [Bacteroidales bacterium]